MEAWIQSLTEIGLFAVAAVGGLILWRLRSIEQKIDGHIKESVEIQKTITRIDTTQDLHIKNGHRHFGDS